MINHEQYTPYEYSALGEQLGDELNLKPPPTFSESIMAERPTVSSGAVLANIKAKTKFVERGAHWQIAHDTIGLVRKVAGKMETYDAKLTKEAQKGKKEAASFGLAQIGEQKVVMFGMHWDFFAGSLGVVAGEKFQAAADLAIKENLPFVSIYSSAGVRQQENFAGLDQMERMVNAITNFKEKSKQPHIAVLSGQVWGGISASAVPQADIKIALAGTDTGFTGPRVIETYEGKPVPKGAQSAEAHVLHRNLDVLVRDQDELLDYLNTFFTATKKEEKKLTKETIPTLRIVGGSEIKREGLFEGRNRFISPLENPEITAQTPVKEKQIFPKKEIPTRDKLYLQYENLLRNAKRPDAEFLMTNAFTDFIKLYNPVEKKTETTDIIENPAIIAGIGKIGPQRFLVIGDQPSYYQSYDGVKKLPANPEPKDFKYLMKMLKMGNRMELPVVFLTDTPGAKPTLASEEIGQSDMISDALEATSSYKYPIISVVTGILGSGGGLATTTRGNHRAMFENSMSFVAEARSATSILYNESNPTVDQVKDTLNSMRATAQDQLQLGLIDGIVPESDNPFVTARNLHDMIANTYANLPRRIKADKNNRIRRSQGVQVKK